ncbi:Uncharacterised protein [Legionella busanensis]|uniref:Opacity protein and related surface antigens n=1 Tax=Legionella busanensis TaxID=190655 RepID=A0A378JP74_9GAMM|nr:hypothetical protein [Legionella busanensis]STX52478.1 Uncharacterised protein [Legionella busanensis]
MLKIKSLKWLAILSVFSFIQNAFCDGIISSPSAFYWGGQAGYGNQSFKNGGAGSNQFDSFVITPVHDKSNDGPAGRLMVGYEFNLLLAIEAGVGLYSDLI